MIRTLMTGSRVQINLGQNSQLIRDLPYMYFRDLQICSIYCKSPQLIHALIMAKSVHLQTYLPPSYQYTVTCMNL